MFKPILIMSIILISLLAIVAVASEAGAVVAPSVPSYSSILQSLQSLVAATNVKAAATAPKNLAIIDRKPYPMLVFIDKEKM